LPNVIVELAFHPVDQYVLNIADGRMTKDVRALELYELARSIVEAKGRFVSVGVLPYKEYKLDELSIRFWPSTRHLEVWQKRKLLAVNYEYGQLTARRYVPGDWEVMLQDVAESSDGASGPSSTRAQS
jgi:hypothetical protein